MVRGGTSQAHYLGAEGCVEVLEGLLEAAAIRAGLDPLERPVASTAQLLLAGMDLPEELSALRTAMDRLGWSRRLVIGNDTEALLRAGTDRGWGIAVVCGTGINCLGLAPDGREARFLSFGPVSGDWGGGYDVGLAALSAAARSEDRRGPTTSLERTVPAHFGYETPLELATAIHAGSITHRRLIELAPLVLESCAGDEVAAEIVAHVKPLLG